jgi:antitoxin VapB
MNERVKIEMDGGVQKISVPAEFKLEGSDFTIRRFGNGIVIEPISRQEFDWEAWSASLDKFRDVPFMPEGREQPPMPPPFDVFKD